MKHLGDISKINGALIAPVDIITFGSPCQDLSVAGKQVGIEGSRSGLFREAVRIIKEMREATNGKQPRFAIWENVPGAFSSNKGADFQTVLHELCKITEPQTPVIAIPKAGWPPAGQLTNVGGGSLAYRTIDAQFHGVPQRRRRIILVCDFAGQCAGNILFKPGGLPGYPAQGVCEGESTARAADGGTDSTIICFAPGGASRLGGNVWENKSPTLLASVSDNMPPAICYTIDPFASNSMKSKNPNSGFHETAVARCLDTTSASPACNQGGNVVVLQGSMIGRADENGPNGAGIAEGACFCLTATDRHAVVVFDGESVTSPINASAPQVGDPCHTLGAGGAGRTIAVIENHPNDSRINISESDTVQTLTGRMGTGGGNVPLVMLEE